MKHAAIGLLAAAAAFLSACSFFPPIMGSGRATTTAFAARDFSRVTASQACTVSFVPDSTYSVQVTVDDNVVPYLVVSRDTAGALCVGLDQTHSYAGVTFKAEVHAPALTCIDLSGASHAVVGTGFSSSNPLQVTLLGASSATLSGITCGGISADVSGASTLTATGTVGPASLVVSGASTVDLLGCAASSASVELSGASTAKVNVATGTLNVSASGASILYYRGSPTLNVTELSGASSIVHVY